MDQIEVNQYLLQQICLLFCFFVTLSLYINPADDFTYCLECGIKTTVCGGV